MEFKKYFITIKDSEKKRTFVTKKGSVKDALISILMNEISYTDEIIDIIVKEKV